ncbi:ABC transporter ATP-binding protein [Ferrovibrio sp.]|uniref:ABC transporter ATP-binding protein n=1 Tax=Ferrovibrio sp. TaxID=1917215 RepID=UPI001B736E02|nr:ABC transporter ATP-binding protein [Ferrovibrio sp.]MBP7065020.1 ABC transporter ATP-binding protein [Ferrovibrio sp.]
MRPLIRARDVAKRFGGPDGLLALDRVSLEIAEGEFVSLLGPSGCGKSTFLRCLAGLERPSDGALELNGVPITEPPERLGIAFQRDALLDWCSVRDNVLLPAEFGNLPRRDYAARADQLLAMVGLAGFGDAYPATLSGGMRQRVAICRSLLLEPQLLLMDEPFGALDAMTRDQLNVDLQKIWAARQMTTVFVTHSISEAVYLSSRVLVFSARPGRILADIAIDLPQPRKLADRESAAFTGYVRQIRGIFESMGLIHD